MTDNNIHALYGLKYNPFLPNLPIETLWVTPAAEIFAHRIQTMIHWRFVTGDPGQGKAKQTTLKNGETSPTKLGGGLRITDNLTSLPGLLSLSLSTFLGFTTPECIRIQDKHLDRT